MAICVSVNAWVKPAENSRRVAGYSATFSRKIPCGCVRKHNGLKILFLTIERKEERVFPAVSQRARQTAFIDASLFWRAIRREGVSAHSNDSP